MEICVYFRTYNSYGGHRTLTLVGDFLVTGAPDFGTALSEIEVTIHFRSDGPPRKTLESMYERFHANLPQLPKVTYRRQKSKAEIVISSDLATAEKIGERILSHSLFCATCSQVSQNLELVRKRLKKEDDFDFRAFRNWIDNRIDHLPTDSAQLAQLEFEIKTVRAAKNAALSEWEKLAIDFDDFHPESRSILDDPRLWDVCDDWSPNGNDTGADVLALYRDWCKKSRTTLGEKFFKQLMLDWEVGLPLEPNDEYSSQMYHQSIVGLAFAQLKLHAKCEPTIATLALESLDTQPQNELTEKIRSILRRCI